MKKTTYAMIGLLALVFIIETIFIFILLSRDPHHSQTKTVVETGVLRIDVIPEDQDLIRYDKVEVRTFQDPFIVNLPNDVEYSDDIDLDGGVSVDTLVIITTGNKIILQ